jgi:hypothetical protein
LLDVARGEVSAPSVVFSEGSYPGYTDAKLSAESDGWKLIHNPEENSYELYDLAEDPEELYNLYGSDQGLSMTGRLMPEMSQYATRLSGEAPAVELTSPERKQLENLGYVESGVEGNMETHVEAEAAPEQRPAEGKLTREEVMERVRARIDAMRSQKFDEAKKMREEGQ